MSLITEQWTTVVGGGQGDGCPLANCKLPELLTQPFHLTTHHICSSCFVCLFLLLFSLPLLLTIVHLLKHLAPPTFLTPVLQGFNDNFLICYGRKVVRTRHVCSQDYYLLTIESDQMVKLQWNIGGTEGSISTPFSLGLSQLHVTR